MKSKPLIETGPIDVDRETFLEMCKVSDADPVGIALLTNTPIGPANSATTAGPASQGRMFKARGVFREHVKAVLNAYQLPPEVAKNYVQSARNQVLSDALISRDYKTALEAAKQIGTDQSIFGPTQIELKVDAINDLLEKSTAEVIEAVYLPDEEDNEENKNDV